MPRRFAVGDCVRVPDRRIGRVRAVSNGHYRIRVQRRTSKTHQFLELRAGEPLPSSLGTVRLRQLAYRIP